jgi:hypothetical protein
VVTKSITRLDTNNQNPVISIYYITTTLMYDLGHAVVEHLQPDTFWGAIMAEQAVPV